MDSASIDMLCVYFGLFNQIPVDERVDCFLSAAAANSVLVIGFMLTFEEAHRQITTWDAGVECSL